MKYQVLFLKNNEKYLLMSSAAVVIGAWRVNRYFSFCNKHVYCSLFVFFSMFIIILMMLIRNSNYFNFVILPLDRCSYRVDAKQWYKIQAEPIARWSVRKTVQHLSHFRQFQSINFALGLKILRQMGWSDGANVLSKFQCRGILLICIIVGQGPIALVVGMGCLNIFSLVYHFSFLSPSFWETARYRQKYCLKGPLSPKTTNQPNLAAKNKLK